MRLINVETLRPQEFLDDQIPAYAILSHTWGSDLEEITLRDVEQGNINKSGAGSAKLRGCCEQARMDGSKYVWVDTCCINKSDLVELSEAINSMFRWYKKASVCYAYLSDVPSNQNPRDDSSHFRASRWFKRGWTLQELLAPERLVFYSSDWRPLGTKTQLSAVIESITGIPRLFLKGINDLRSASVAQRMAWAAQRDTKRKEDLAYCLLGIFGITMPMLYGEGGSQAFVRLQKEIMRDTKDHSILAWGLGGRGSSANGMTRSTATGFLAAAPSDFTNSRSIVPRDQSARYLDALEISGGSLSVSLSLTEASDATIGLLNCGPEDGTRYAVGIPLTKVVLGESDTYIRPVGYPSVLRPVTTSDGLRKRIHVENGTRLSSQGSEQLRWIYEDDNFAKIHLELVEVVPHSSWDKERAVLLSALQPNGSSAHPIIIRLQHAENHSQDFILVLGVEQRGAYIEACPSLAICSRDASLEGLAEKLPHVTRKASSMKAASNGFLNLQVMTEPMPGRSMFNIRPEAMLYPPDVTIDITNELQKPHRTLEIEEILHREERWAELEQIDYDEETYELKRTCGQRPLLWASENGHIEMVRLLLDHGINVATANNGNRTPLVAALEKGHGVVAYLLLATILQVYLNPMGEHKVRFEGKDMHTALSYATDARYDIVVQLLLENSQQQSLKGSVELNEDQMIEYANKRVESNPVLKRFFKNQSNYVQDMLKRLSAFDGTPLAALKEQIVTISAHQQVIYCDSQLWSRLCHAYDQFHSKLQNLKRPLLITVMTDGEPNGEEKDEFVNAIVECGYKLEAAGMSRESVKFIIGPVKRAARFLEGLRNAYRISRVAYVTKDRLDEKFKSMRDTDPDELDPWLVETLFSPLKDREEI
ncbi:hypothetical protein S40288_07721 [Stachybotrys chartarum IBT 40288]|nr:hypothetical protein S40288_07721 [Stachybotrys chartarum IBT 40288]